MRFRKGTKSSFRNDIIFKAFNGEFFGEGSYTNHTVSYIYQLNKGIKSITTIVDYLPHISSHIVLIHYFRAME